MEKCENWISKRNSTLEPAGVTGDSSGQAQVIEEALEAISPEETPPNYAEFKVKRYDCGFTGICCLVSFVACAALVVTATGLSAYEAFQGD